jgi:predicted phosphodiesterase
MNITVIPDIHADLQRLNWSLSTSSTSSELFFLGDLIDAGKGVKKPNDLGVLKKVRELISTGKAKAVLGNHE